MTVDCTLCELPADDVDVVDEDGNRFCCEGCRHVHHSLPEMADVTAADVRSRESTDTAEPDVPPEGYERTYLDVEGMHCVTCESFIEAVATGSDGIDGASANYVTDTVRVDFDPDRMDPAGIRESISGLGYTAYPREDAISKIQADNRAFARLAVGVLVGMMVMFQYVVIIYPTYFGGLFYDARTAAFLAEMMDATGGGYFFVVIGVLSSIVLLYTGKPILRGAWVSVRMRSPNMDLLVAIAAVSAYLYSTLVVFTGGSHIYYDVTVAIVVIVTVGNHHESSVKARATELLSDLTTVQVDEATRLDGADEETVQLDDLSGGDRILVRSGERVPVDGTIVDGNATADESVITGESLPVPKTTGDVVVGGSIVVDGALVVSVDDGATSSLDRITDLVWDLQSSTSGIQKLADKLATIFVPLVLVLALVVGGGYLVFGADVRTAMLAGLTVLIVSCPCALGLATPLAVASGVREALEHGIVVFDDTVFERIREADTLVLDKTGTLTTGNMHVIDSDAPDSVLALAGVLERRATHPVAEAIASTFAVDTDGGRTLPPDDPDERYSETGDANGDRTPDLREDEETRSSSRITAFKNHPRGVTGSVDGTPIAVGHPSLFDDIDWVVPDGIRSRIDDERDDGRVPVAVGRDGRADGVVVVGDELRPGVDETLSWFADEEVEVVVLTGDDEQAAMRFREHDHVDEVFAGVPPEAKAETVDRFSARGQTVMVGDGTNDAPALAAADLGVALGGGTAIAADAADVAIVDDDLRSIARTFELATAAGKRVKGNIAWAFLYNAIAIPLAVTGLLNPLFAAAAMASSSLLVVTNSSRQLLEDRS